MKLKKQLHDRILYSVLLVGIIFTYVLAISANQGHNVSAVKPGSSTGSFVLSGFESINPYSGSLNFSLPLLSVGGRGAVSSAINLTINQKYTVGAWHYPGDPYPNFYAQDYYAESGDYAFDNGYSPGLMVIEKKGLFSYTNCPNNSTIFQQTLTTISFIAPGGTEYNLRDRGSNGRPNNLTACQLNPPSRGTVFDSADGITATFISDVAIYDENYAGSEGRFAGGLGYVILRDGTTYRIEGGLVVWQRDRNGNKISYNYTYVNGRGVRISKITDSLNREVNFEYNVQDVAPYGLCDRITYSGFGGAARTLRISYRNLNDVLRSGYSIQTRGQLFPEVYAYSGCNQYDPAKCASYTHNPQKPSAVWLPDGRSYEFQYNSYAELARVKMPTGSVIEYDWVNGFSSGSGIINGVVPGWTNDGFNVYRRVSERRIYDDGVNLANKLVVRATEYLSASKGYVIEDFYNSSGNLLSRVKHYYHGISSTPTYSQNYFYESWLNGREYQTDTIGFSGTDLLRTTTTAYQQTAPSWYSGSADHAPINNPTVAETTTLLAESNQISKQTFAYDGFNNLTDTYEYDYGIGAPGPFLRRSHTDYLISNPVNNLNYTSDSVHIFGLPAQSWISSDSAGNTKVSLIQFEYDNYSPDTRHASLVSRNSVSGHDTTNFGSGVTGRGNTTQVTSYANASGQTGAVVVSSQYDILGNLVKAIDGKGYASVFSYSDNFGVPDGESRTNNAPSQLNGLNSFAFPSSATDALNFTTYNQFDYSTGSAVNSENANGMISKVFYNDLLDRPTQTVRAVGTSLEAQTTFIYDDANLRVQTTADLNVLNDNLLKTESFYDKMGRTIETRSYETGGIYKATAIQYDSFGRAYKTSNPYRPNEIDATHPILWTTNTFDALGRVTSLVTPDGAVVSTAYNGDRSLVTDQAGKQRISRINALGQSTDIWEITASDSATVSVSFPNHAEVLYGYRTSYEYDVVDNLKKVVQGNQTRTFVYDSLSRLSSVTYPEMGTSSASGTNNYTYDANGNLIQKTDARQVSTTYSYDPLNRMLTRNYSAPTGLANYQAAPNVTYTYDDSNVPNSKGKLTKVSTSVSTTEYLAFDKLGNVSSHKQTTDGNNYTTGYSYSLNGAMTEETYPSGRKVKIVLNNAAEPLMIQSKKNSNYGYFNYASHFSYTAAGAISSMQLGNGRWENTTFNQRLQPIQISLGTTRNATDLLKLDYSYGGTQNNGNLQSQTISVPSVGNNPGLTLVQTYTYDSLNRLKKADEKPYGYTEAQCDQNPLNCWRQTYVYDRYGNKNFDTNNNNTTTLGNCAAAECNPSFDTSKNRYSSGQGYTHDNAGNIVNDPKGRSLIYDGENKQVSVSNQNGTLGNYFYDGDGRRVKKIVPATGETTIFVYNGQGKLVAEYSTIIESTSQAKLAYLTNDHLGSPRANTNQNGSVTARHDYHPFGEEILSNQRTPTLGYNQDTVRNRFTSKERDLETGLDAFGARYYSSNLGRFYGVDPLHSSGGTQNPQSWNKYAYTHNNPINLIDIAGLYVWGEGAEDESEEGRKRREEFRTWHQELKNALANTQKGTKEYNRIKKVLDALGEEGKKGALGIDVKINFKALNNRENANAGVDVQGKITNAAYTINFNTNQMGSINESTLAHEGQHIVDFKDALDHATIQNGKIVIAAGYDLNRYEREDRGIETGQFVSRALGKTDTSYGGSAVYRKEWGELDAKTLEANMYTERKALLWDAYNFIYIYKRTYKGGYYGRDSKGPANEKLSQVWNKK